MEKLKILGDSAKYDASCASSGSAGRGGSFGKTAVPGLCHTWSADGRCVSLLKVLMTNKCMYHCAYCVNSALRDCPRAEFTPRELCDLTVAFYKRNYVEGLFLSSGIAVSPNRTMANMVETVRLLRAEGFGGYVHMKSIPGADRALLDEAALLCDRMSVNIELPSQKSLLALAPDKSAKAILDPMGYVAGQIFERRDPRAAHQPPPYAPAGQSTQLIVGATPESDRSILRLSEALYRKYALKRVYFSAFMPVVAHPLLPGIKQPPLLREHRLYQADWLMRFYGFSAEEILDDAHPQLDEQLDPKCAWALRNPQFFPVDVATAPLGALLRVPGIGQISARRILSARRYGGLTLEDVKRCGTVMKRAQYFITCRGRAPGIGASANTLRAALLGGASALPSFASQVSLFDPPPGAAFPQLQLVSEVPHAVQYPVSL
ncbi:MAG: putative DNA modification/repair radical SAM protein [Eubacteriales bacterium]|nr:putative DNA modification/repair radical SAM protein [Eubacteriales bacterium]